jgi:small conductance mechanosensitive channel
LIKQIIRDSSAVATEPAPQVGIEAFGDSSILIAYRCWIPTHSYFEVRYAVNRGVLKALREANVTTPFPQREVRLLTS